MGRRAFEIRTSRIGTVEIKCERGDPENGGYSSARVARGGAFPLDQEILELAMVLIAPGTNPERAGPDAVYIGGVSREV